MSAGLRSSVFITTSIGLLLGVGYIVPALWWAGLIAVAWLTSLLFREQTPLRWYSLWYIWFLKSLCFSSWVWAMYPIDWLGVPLGIYELPIIAFYWVTVAGALGVGGVGLYTAARLLVRLRRWIALRWQYAAFPFLWLGAEVFSSLVFSFVLHGPGGTIGTSFTMGYIGYLLAEHTLLFQVAQFGGVYVLSVAYVALAVGAWLAYHYMNRVLVALVCVTALLLGYIPVANIASEEDAYSVVVVDTQWDHTAWEDEYITATREAQTEALNVALALEPDYIIFPEDSRVFDPSLPPRDLELFLRFQLHTTDAVIIDSGQAQFEDSLVLQANVYDGQARELAQSQKRYLVPQGEFMPYLYQFFFSFFESSDTSKMLSSRLAYVVGPHTSQSNFTARMPGVLFCFEVVDARGVRKILRERTETPPFIAHVVSHAWIHESQIFRRQLTTMLRVQAVWNNIPIVVAGNYIPGEVIYANGRAESLTPVTTLDSITLSTVRIPKVGSFR